MVEAPGRGNLGCRSCRVLDLGARLAIAAAFAGLVPNGASLAVSIGTTPEIAVRELRGAAGITLLTNNLHTATSVCEREGWTVMVSSGRIRPGDHDILCPDAEAFFDRFQVDLGVFGVAGVAEDGTFPDFTEGEVASRMAIQRNSRSSVLVLDCSKFGRPAQIRGSHIGEVDRVICDAGLPPAILAGMGGSWPDVIVAERVQ